MQSLYFNIFIEDDFSPLQLQTKELYSLQLDKISGSPLYSLFESNLKEFMNCMTRYLTHCMKIYVGFFTI